MLLRTRELLNAALAVHDSGTVWVAVAAFGTLIVVLAVLGSRQRRAGGLPAAGSVRVLRRAGRGLRLTGRESRVLRALVGGGHYHRQTDLFRNRALLDGVLLRGRAALPAVLRTRHLGRLALLLSIKARVEARGAATIRSSSSLGAGTRIVMTPALLGRYESQVIAGLPNEIACRIPGDDTGVELRWRRGALVTVWVEPPAAAATPVFTTVLGYGWVGGRHALLLARTVTPATHRPQRTPRRCVITRVIARLSLDEGKQRQRAVLLPEQQCRGTLVSMVAGRAGIRSTAPLRAGSLVKLVIEPGSGARVPLYGKVVRSPRRPAAGGMMQVQLTGRSQRHLSQLYRFVEQFHAALPAAHA